MKKNFRLFCFGFGQVAKYFVKNLIKNNFNFDLITTNTTQTQQEEIDGLKYKSYHFTDNKFDKNLLNDLDSSNKLLISVPPKNQTDIVLKVFDVIFKKNNPKILDIGSNDGSFLELAKKKYSIALGIEPTNTAKISIHFVLNYNIVRNLN